MTPFQTIVTPAMGVLEIAGAVSGVPYAQGASMALQIINTACSQVAIHKVCFSHANTCFNSTLIVMSVSASLPNLPTDAILC